MIITVNQCCKKNDSVLMDSLCKQNLAVNVDMELLKVCFYGLNHNPPLSYTSHC